MSNTLAVATVTATLRRVVLGSLGVDVPGATVTTLRPDASGVPSLGVNIYLYQATRNNHWMNEDLPTRTSTGDVVIRPRVPLDLHYLFTFYGNEGQLEPQQVLASVARTMHAHPVMTREDIDNAIAANAFLAGSDLALEPELVKFNTVPLSLEELSKLWSVMFQSSYALSMVYTGSVVFVESRDLARRALPVAARDIEVLPFQRAVIDDVESENGPLAPILWGSTIRILGRDLGAAIQEIQIGDATITTIDSQTNNEVVVTLTSPDLRAGIQSVRILYDNGLTSTLGTFVLRPQVTPDQPAVTSAVIPVDFVPDVDRDQRVKLFLNERDAAALASPHRYVFDAPPDNGIPAPGPFSTSRIEFPIHGVAAGEYLVRVQIDGAENELTLGILNTREQYIDPHAVVP